MQKITVIALNTPMIKGECDKMIGRFSPRTFSSGLKFVIPHQNLYLFLIIPCNFMAIINLNFKKRPSI